MKMSMGNVIVGQSGGPTAVINASLAGVFETAKARGAKVYGMLNGIEGLVKESYVDLSEHLTSGMDIEILKRTPSSYLGSCRFKLPDVNKDEEIYTNIFKILNKLEVKHFFYIGGNDSMDTIQKLSAYAKSINSDMTFIGVPKTIDNDLAITDHTPGYGSAAKYIAATMKELICDSNVYDMHCVTIVEIMGRDAGWLTAASALAKGDDCMGPDLIYLPEAVFDYDKFIEKINEVRKERDCITIAVSEGVKDKNGKYVCETDVKDVFGHTMLGGTALYLSDCVGRDLGIKSRGIVFSTIQRCASHLVSRTDVTEAYKAGASAVKFAADGESGKMIIFRRISDLPYEITTETYDINKIANLEKAVPYEWITKDGTYVSDEFFAYARPLITGELHPYMVDGLPRHIYIKK